MNKENYYVTIPYPVLVSKKLNDSDKLVYGEISALSDKNGECNASNKYIAETLDKDIRSVQRAITKLEKQGYLKVAVKKEKGVGTNRTITLANAVPPYDKNVIPPMTNMTHPRMTNLSPVVLEENYIKTKKQESTPYNPPKVESPPKTERWASCPVKASPLREKYSKGHEECREYLIGWEQIRKRGFVNENEQYFKIHDILKAGYDFKDIDKAIRDVERKYGKGQWDFERVARWIEKGGTEYASTNTERGYERITTRTLLGN